MVLRWYSLTLLCCGIVLLLHNGVLADNNLTTEEKAKVQAVTALTKNFTRAEPFENRSAGAATSLATADRNAYSHPQPNLSFADREQFFLGNALFRKLWVSSPSSTLASDGLGPLFNARACQACHIKDGRGHAQESDGTLGTLALRLGRYNSESKLWVGDPVYGEQLQPSAVPGLLAEAKVETNYVSQSLSFRDGTVVTLKKPTYALNQLGYGDINKNTALSPRIPPPMIGMGLLQAISEDDLQALADPNDENEDGISGKRAIVKTPNQQLTGRFGHKASTTNIKQQSANAFSADMGLSTSLRIANHGDCTLRQSNCLALPHGEQPALGKSEVPDDLLQLVTFYSSNLAPPARRNVEDKNVLAGKALFYESGCTGCHIPKFVTSKSATDEQHRFQLIWPYSDLLLHDMGDGLADGLGDNNGGSGNEWRTPPLWGIGLTKTVNPKATFLHDGRANTLLEAILWHGGEATASKESVLAMSKTQREALISFLESL